MLNKKNIIKIPHTNTDLFRIFNEVTEHRVTDFFSGNRKQKRIISNEISSIRRSLDDPSLLYPPMHSRDSNITTIGIPPKAKIVIHPGNKVTFFELMPRKTFISKKKS